MNPDRSLQLNALLDIWSRYGKEPMQVTHAAGSRRRYRTMLAAETTVDTKDNIAHPGADHASQYKERPNGADPRVLQPPQAPTSSAIPTAFSAGIPFHGQYAARRLRIAGIVAMMTRKSCARPRRLR